MSSARRHRLRLPLPLLRSLSGSKQSLREDSEKGYMQPMPHMGHESVALDKLLSLPERSALGGSQLLLWEDKAQNEPESEPRPSEVSPPLPQGFSQSSPRLHNLTSEACPSSCSMAHSRSCESLCGMRPSPSTTDFNWDRKLPVRPSSTGDDKTNWPISQRPWSDIRWYHRHVAMYSPINSITVIIRVIHATLVDEIN